MMLQNLLGFWNGTTTTTSNDFLHYTQLEIIASSNNTLRLRLLSRKLDPFPESELKWTGSQTFTCSLPHEVIARGIQLIGRFDTERQVLAVRFSGSIFDIENYEVELRRDEAKCHKYRRPAASLDYEYRVPSDIPSVNDYFEPGNAADHGLNTADLVAMVRRLLLLNSGGKNDAQVDGILILKDGKLVLEEYFWGLTANDYHDISSCTKSVTSLLFGIAWDMGFIDLEQPVADIFPEISSDWSKHPPVRVKHVLSMTSGTQLRDTAEENEELLCSDRIAHLILSTPRITTPGSTYAYDNSLPILAGMILERKTKQNIASFAAKHLFTPLAIKNPRWTYLPSQKSTIDNSQLPLTSGAIMLPLREFAKLGQLLLSKGAYAGRQIVSTAWLELSLAQHTPLDQYPYGFYWHLNNDPQQQKRHLQGRNEDTVLAIGQGEQICAVLPSLNCVVAWMSSTWVNNFGYRVGLHIVDEEFVSKIVHL